MWNDGEVPATVIWCVQPALQTEEFLAATTALVNEGRTNRKGTLALLQTARLRKKYKDVFRLARPPFVFQKIFFLLLMPLIYISEIIGDDKK